MPVNRHIPVPDSSATSKSIWFLEKFLSLKLISSFHKKTKPPFLPSTSTPKHLFILHNNFSLSNLLACNFVLLRKITWGSSFRISSRRARIVRGFPSPRQFQVIHFMAHYGASIQTPQLQNFLILRQHFSIFSHAYQLHLFHHWLLALYSSFSPVQ